MQTRQYQILSSGLFSLIILSFFLGSTYKTYSQTSGVPITSSTTWTVPTGVTSVNIECWGAGGSGGSSANNAGAGGGGGGAYSRSLNIVVVPGNDYTINVGIGGLAPGKNASGNVGGDTWFLSSSTVFAQGGSGGVSAGSGGAGGLGGDAANGIGNDVKFSGGVGADGTTVGGGGGYGAGNVTGGTPASGATGGIAPTGGGNGGDGGNNSDGTVGSPPGGAGGGAYGRNNLGAAGANGQVILIFSAGPECPTSTDIDPSTLQTVCEDVATNQLTATINGAGAYTPLYQWYYNTDTNTNDPNDPNANLIAGATSASYTPLSTASEIGTRYYFCVGYATDNGCTQTNDDQTLASTPVIITVNAIPSAPTGTAAQSFCAIDSPTVASLSATGTSILWYDAPSGGSLLAGSTSLVNGNHYYATQTISSCESDTRFDVTVTVSDPATPTGTAAQTFCAIDSPTVASLSATGTSIQWYDAPSGGSLLAGSTSLVNGNHYYATQTVSSCESDTRFDVTVTVSDPAAPTGTAAQTFCATDNPTVANLSATGTSIQWYAASTGGIPLLSTVALVDGTHYFASQTVSGCESDTRFDVTVTLKNLPELPVINGLTTVTTGNNYTYDIPSVPDATNYTWGWPGNPGGWTLVSGQGTNSLTVTAGTNSGDDITVFVTNSCGDGPEALLTVFIGAAPECPTSTDINPSTSQTVCEDVATNQLTATINGAGAFTPLYQWYYNTDTNTNDPNDPNANLIAGATSASYTPLSTASEIGTRYYFCVGYATDNGCTQTNDDQTLASTPVIITVNAIPSAPTGTAAQSFCAIDSPTVASLSATGTSIQWYDAPSGGSLLAGSTSLVNGNHYYATQTISSCESDTRFDVTVTVSDPPTTADAGPDQNISVDTATLAGNTPTSGTGMWNLISGSGTPTSPTSPTSGVTGLSNGANVFRWTISNVPCTDSWSEVTITTSFTASNPPTITLGTIPTICSGTTSVGLPYSATTNSPDKYSINFYDVTFTDVTNADLPVSPIAIDVPPSTPAGTYNAILTVTNTTTLLSSANYVIKITVIDIPSTPIISGETNVPENSDGFKYSTANVPNVTYNWDVPTGWNITDGDTTNRITVTTGALGQGGDITVTVTNICDTSQGSLTVTVSDATDHTLYNCTSCHITHNAPGSSLTAVFGNALLCQSCHTSTGAASAKPMIEAYNGTRSHAWDALAINPSKEVLLPDDSQMKLRVVDSRIICSTCHDQHNSSAGTPHLRVDNTGDALCKDCHRERDLGLYSTDNVNNRSSHPVGITYDGADSRFNASPTNTLLKAGKVECSSCHGVHDDKDATLGLEANGNLLRTTNDANLCKDCHSYGDHMGMNCLDCHQVHNAANQYNNIYLIKDSILTLEPILRPVQFLAETGANSFVDGDGNGVCEVCHDPLNGNPDRFLNDGTGVYHSGDEGPTDPKIGVNCTSCHPHSTNFTPIACHSCHETPDAYPTSGAHAKHAGSPYYFDCMTCHFGFGNNNESSHPEGVTPADVAFDPNGMATRNGQDANTPIWNSGAKTCDNVYCHSDGVSAEGTAEGSTVFGGVWEIAGTVPRTPPALPNFVTTPAWDSGTITCGECHLASANPTVSTTDWPQTGQHTGKGAHLVACWWCHNTDGTQTYMGTYGTTEHINGNVLFIPEFVSNLGTFLNLPVPGGGDGNTASSGHCGSIAGGGKTCWY